MTTPPLDATAVQALVAEVIRRLRASQPAAPAPRATAVVAPPAAPSPATAVPGRVITLAQLERLPAGTRVVLVDPKAVVTPSARDHARDEEITIVRGTAAATAAAPARPFVVAQAACRGDGAARAAAIARAVPAAQQLPASGLADVVAALASHASKDAARGVLLTGRPAVALVLANRSASLRAVSARDAAGLAAAAADAAANLLVIDPATFAGGSLERVCAEFHASPSPAVPAELSHAPAGCGCTH